MFDDLDEEPFTTLVECNSKTKDEDSTNQIVTLCQKIIKCIVKDEDYPKIQKTIKAELEKKFTKDSFTVIIENDEDDEVLAKAGVGQYYYSFRLTKDGMDSATMIIYQK